MDRTLVSRDIALDKVGNLFIADSATVRRADAQTGIINTVAGTGLWDFSGDGDRRPTPVCPSRWGSRLDDARNLFISQTFNLRIRFVDAVTGIIKTVAGLMVMVGFSAMEGRQHRQLCIYASRLALDGTGNLFIVDHTNQRIGRLDADTGIITTVAGKRNHQQRSRSDRFCWPAVP